MSTRSIDPDPLPTGQPWRCNRDPGAPCPGPAITLLDAHFHPKNTDYTPAGDLHPEVLNRHVSSCSECFARLIGCGRAGCDNAWPPLEDMVEHLAQSVVRSLAAQGWPFEFRPATEHSKTSEAIDVARVKGIYLLLTHPQLAEGQDRGIGIANTRGFLRTAMANSLRSWRRHLIAWDQWDAGLPLDSRKPDDNDDKAWTPTADHLDYTHDPAAVVDINFTIEILNRLLAQCRDTLREQRHGKALGELFDLWLDTKLRDQRVSQTALAVQMKALGIDVHQTTVSRWLTKIRLHLAPLLGDPDNGLSEAVRQKALGLFLGEDPPNGAPEAEDDPPERAHAENDPGDDEAADPSDETGTDHD